MRLWSILLFVFVSLIYINVAASTENSDGTSQHPVTVEVDVGKLRKKLAGLALWMYYANLYERGRRESLTDPDLNRAVSEAEPSSANSNDDERRGGFPANIDLFPPTLREIEKRYRLSNSYQPMYDPMKKSDPQVPVAVFGQRSARIPMQMNAAGALFGKRWGLVPNEESLSSLGGFGKRSHQAYSSSYEKRAGRLFSKLPSRAFGKRDLSPTVESDGDTEKRSRVHDVSMGGLGKRARFLGKRLKFLGKRFSRNPLLIEALLSKTHKRNRYISMGGFGKRSGRMFPRLPAGVFGKRMSNNQLQSFGGFGKHGGRLFSKLPSVRVFGKRMGGSPIFLTMPERVAVNKKFPRVELSGGLGKGSDSRLPSHENRKRMGGIPVDLMLPERLSLQKKFSRMMMTGEQSEPLAPFEKRLARVPLFMAQPTINDDQNEGEEVEGVQSGGYLFY